jgi:hypothetical protein
VARVYSPAKDIHLNILTNISDLLILGFHGGSLLMLIMMLNPYMMWIWPMFPAFWMNRMDESYLLQPCKWKHHVPAKCLATLVIFTQFKYWRVESTSTDTNFFQILIHVSFSVQIYSNIVKILVWILITRCAEWIYNNECWFRFNNWNYFEVY